MADHSTYKVGGSLDGNSAFYVERPADEDLYRRLRGGDDCFVFNSRQMGKSSLRVRTMRRLEAEGVTCAVIDPQSRGTSPTEDQWYAGTIKRLLEDLGLTEVVTFSAWWKDAAIQVLSPVNRFEEFIDKILLTHITGAIVIFVEEVDNLLSLSFDTDGFFGMIRSLHERRTEHPNYQRLSFCFLGVATPYDLIRDQNRSAFNIGHAVELTGLDRRDAKPLLAGLVGRVADPSAVLDAVLHWSGGQPFLTQKLLSLVSAHCDQNLPAGELVATIAGEQIICNWESQDLPVHLRTIRDRLLQGDERHKGRLLGLVQSIQERGEIPADASREQMQLRLAGLVVPKEGQLRIYNPIYAAVFNPGWVRSQLSELRPPIYGEAIRAWESAAHPERPSHLIRGAALEEALRWAKGKSLSPIDQEFLDASREAEERATLAAAETRLAAEQARVAEHRALVAERDKRLAERTASNRRKLSVVLSMGMVAMTGLSVFAWHQKQLAHWREQATLIMSEATKTPVEALIRAIALKSQTDRPGLKELANQATESLARALVTVFDWGEVDRLIGHKGAISAAGFSPNGHTIYSSSFDGTLRLWDVNTGHPIGQPMQGHHDRVRDAAFSPDGRRAVSVAEDRTLRLWVVANGKPIGPPKVVHTDAIRAVTFSPDGQRLVTGSADKTLRIWDAWTLKPISTPLVGHKSTIRDVDYSPDGKRIVSSSADKTLRVWDALTGQPIGQPLVGHDGDVRAVAFSPDNQVIVSGSTDRTIRRWDVNTGQQIGPPLLGHSDGVRAVAINHGGTLIVSGSADNTLRLWDAATGKAIGSSLHGHSSSINAVAFSPDGHQIISGSSDRTLRVWEMPVGHPINVSPFRGKLVIRSLAFSPDGRKLVIGLDNHTLRLWDGKTIREMSSSRFSQSKPVIAVAFSPDGRQVVSGSEDNSLLIWDALTGRSTRPLLTGHTGAIRGVAFSPDGKTIVSGSVDTTLRRWDTTTGKAIGEPLRGHTDWVRAVAYRPDGRKIVSGSSDTTLQLWDSATGQPHGPPMRGHDDSVITVAFSPDGRRIVSGSSDSTLRLWDADTGTAIGGAIRGHKASVRAVTFSRDGRKLISASSDNTLRIWDSSTGKLLSQTTQANENLVTILGFNLDAHRIAIVVSENTLRVQDIDPRRNLKLACTRLNHHHLLLSPKDFDANEHFQTIASKARKACSTTLKPTLHSS